MPYNRYKHLAFTKEGELHADCIDAIDKFLTKSNELPSETYILLENPVENFTEEERNELYEIFNSMIKSKQGVSLNYKDTSGQTLKDDKRLYIDSLQSKELKKGNVSRIHVLLRKIQASMFKLLQIQPELYNITFGAIADYPGSEKQDPHSDYPTDSENILQDIKRKRRRVEPEPDEESIIKCNKESFVILFNISKTNEYNLWYQRLKNRPQLIDIPYNHMLIARGPFVHWGAARSIEDKNVPHIRIHGFCDRLSEMKADKSGWITYISRQADRNYYLTDDKGAYKRAKATENAIKAREVKAKKVLTNKKREEAVRERLCGISIKKKQSNWVKKQTKLIVEKDLFMISK
jgi:hypothetical protein